MFQLQALDHVALSVNDVERSARWYIDILGFELQHADLWDGVPVFIGKGGASIALFPAKPNAEARSTSSSRGETRILHFAFRADRENFLAAQSELKKRGLEFEFQDHEISHSIYFHDPDHHQIEITTYELK
ncbi:MAG: VOC family protein [Spartobacteria bacterium]